MDKIKVYIEYLKDKTLLKPELVTVNSQVFEVTEIRATNDYQRVNVDLYLVDSGILSLKDVELTIKQLPAPRPSWDEYFLEICKAVSLRADCRRAQHGCVIVKENRIVSTGYNGSPSGGASCLAGECPRGLLSNDECRSLSSYENCISLHAEQNAVAYASGRDTRGATLYVTGPQCDMCRKLTRAAGIVKVIWPTGEEVF